MKSPVAKRLKEVRVESKLTQKQLGIMIGIDEFVSSARMNQYEKGIHTPNVTTVQKISNILQVPPPYFYASDENLAYVIKKYGKLDDNQKNKLIKFLRSM